MDSIIYVTQECVVRQLDGSYTPRFDLSAAQQFGEIRFLTKQAGSALSPEVLVQELRSGLKDYSDNDYLLMLGDPSVMAAAAAIAADVNGGWIKILKWDRRAGVYVPVTFDTLGETE